MEKKKEKLKILVCAHKPDEQIRNYPPYMPIQVGAALHPEMDLGFQKDNVGDNISEKNPRYCELSAIYWGWKNIKNVEYLGLAHYRRYFDIDINENNVDEWMKGCDIIVLDLPLQHSYNTNYINAAMGTTKEDFWIYMNELIRMYPQYTSEIYNYYFNNHRYIPCTMFITKKELYDKFCEFVFPLFQQLENKLKKHPYSRQNRDIAYFGEYSLGLFISCQKLKVKRVPIVKDGKSFRLSFPNNIKRYLFELHIRTYALLRNIFKKNRTIKMPDDVKLGLRNDGYDLFGI